MKMYYRCNLNFCQNKYSVISAEKKLDDPTCDYCGNNYEVVSKKDAITGLRTIDSPFHNEKHYRKQGQKSLNLILRKAKKDGVKVFSSDAPEYKRVKRIVDRLVDASHYRNHKDKVKYEVIDYEDFNALAFGGGYFVVFSGLLEKTNDDELAYVIAHELAHNTAGHIEETYFLKIKDVFGDKPTGAYSTSFTNINEQEADRIAIVYTALAGFNPEGSATIWEKQFQGIEQYAFYRSHPANPQRVKANRYASNKIKKHYIKGKVNPNVDKILKCNELFCNTSIADLSKDGSGGGVLKSLEVIGDLYLKNKQAKEEKKKQEQEIAKSRKILAQKRLLTPPNIKWDNTVPLRYKGTINRHNQKSGLNFGFAQNLSRGLFYYNFNNKLEKGEITFTGTNQHGYWFKWNDKYGHGNLQLREYTDGSLRGIIYIDDGTMLGKKLGEFIGFKK